MISQNAQRSLSQILQQGIKASLLASPLDSVAIEPVADTSGFSCTQIVVLSVSSYLFRLLVLIYFTPDALTKAHFATLNKMDVQSMDARAFADAIGECGNICCGSLNRELAMQFPHVGMSTPNILDRQCALYLGALGSTYQQHFDISIPQGPRLHASLCISEFEDLDFDIQISETNSGGELEMF
jgi:hypothetical protein